MLEPAMGMTGAPPVSCRSLYLQFLEVVMQSVTHQHALPPHTTPKKNLISGL